MTDTQKKTDAWMPIWIGAYMADTMKLTTIQHGAYLLLLMAYWRERKPLADSDDELRSITKLERAEWKRNRPVLEKFFRVADGVWWHKRVEQEMVEADKRSNAASSKASSAAKARWEQANKDAPSIAPSIAQEVLGSCPTPSPREEEKEPIGSSSSAEAEATSVIAGLPCPHSEFRRLYAEKCPELSEPKHWNATRQAPLRSRWAEIVKTKGWTTQAQGAAWLERFFDAVQTSDFLMGRTARAGSHKAWRCDVDFLISPNGFWGVVEGKYENREAA